MVEGTHSGKDTHTFSIITFSRLMSSGRTDLLMFFPPSSIAVQCNVVQRSVLYSTVLYSTLLYSTLLYRM